MTNTQFEQTNDYQVNPLVGVGPIQFGMKRSELRQSLSIEYKEFQRSNADFTEDYFEAYEIFIRYKQCDTVENVEVSYDTPLTISYKNENLFKPFNELKSFLEKDDPELETDHEGITSHKLGIGAWYPHLAEEPENLPESIILFEDGYYK